MTTDYNGDITVGFYTSQAELGDSGVGIYQKNVVKAFNELNDDGIELRCVHYEDNNLDIYKSNRDIIIPQPKFGKLTSMAGVSGTLRHHKNYLSEPYLNEYDLDIIHIQSIPYKRPFWLISDDTKIVSTVHSPWDLVTNRPWEDNDILRRIKFNTVKRFIYARLSRKIDTIITVSKFMKNKLVKKFNISPKNIHVIYNAPDKTNYSQAPKQLPIQKKSSEYILHVSHFNSRKNPEGVIRGFEVAKKDCNLTKDLIIAGGGWDEKIIDKYILDKKIKNHIHILGYVPRQVLINLYENASIFLLPSYFESCSLAQLESMSYGTPVVTTNSGGLPEVGGEANLYFDDPDNYKQIGQAIVECMNRKDQLKKESQKRIKKFSWLKHANKLATIYRSIA